MAKIGTDFSKARNAWRASATGLQPIEWSVSIIVSLALLQLGLPVLGQFFTVVGWSVSLAASGMQQEDIMKALMADTAFIKSLAFATFVTLIPTSILTAFLAYRGAGWRGGDRQTAIASHFPDLGWLGWFAVVVGFLVFVGGTTIFIRYLSGTMENVGEVEKTVQMLSTDKRALFLVPLAIGLFGPLTEELMFRGPFFSRLLATRLAMVGTVLLTALLFSLMHVSYFALGVKEGLVALIPLFIMGLVLGWLRLRFGSIWVPIVCHSVWNLLACFALFNAPVPGAV